MPGRAGPGDPGGQARDVECTDEFKGREQKDVLGAGVTRGGLQRQTCPLLYAPSLCVRFPSLLSLLPWEQAASFVFACQWKQNIQRWRGTLPQPLARWHAQT